jgi:NADH:ubiquinone oxidoreductase subunit K
MGIKSASKPAFAEPRTVREAVPLVAAATVLAAVGFTSWFWQTQDDSLFNLLPLYVAAAFFCVDMALLTKHLRAKARTIS